MTPGKESEFAEVLVHKLYLELFAVAPVFKHTAGGPKAVNFSFEEFRSRLKGLIRDGLSRRQKEVMEHCLKGKTEREIALVLGITQQVVNIHKHRARRKLHQMCVPVS